MSEKNDSYKGYIGSKKTYLKRKKQLNRDIKNANKWRKRCLAKGIKPRLCAGFIRKRKEDLFVLRFMWNFNKFGFRELNKRIDMSDFYY